ncbi:MULTISPECIES: hypothetical protein [Musicola]|uniref:Uncharacterized protein n=1 Tax=Musicola paradisiaca (strain Ech703) TaxID=579405 RepID=C6C7L5_MUSP7|nr:MULTISPECIES: hypothetical protein [Musicola]ACS85957.1 hypothetical protein Dd703_2170 [Musicola paradisiaca Ech703]
MRGIVVHHEHRIGFIVIRDPDGAFIVAKLKENYDIERGDAVSGELHTAGHTVLLNETNGEEIPADIQQGTMTEEEAINLIVKTANA